MLSIFVFVCILFIGWVIVMKRYIERFSGICFWNRCKCALAIDRWHWRGAKPKTGNRRIWDQTTVVDRFEALEQRVLLSGNLLDSLNHQDQLTVSQAGAVVAAPSSTPHLFETDDTESDPNALNVTKLSQVSLAQFGDGSTRANDITSYVSGSGREYAIIGLEKSIAFVEITDPRHPVIVDVIPGLDEASGGPGQASRSLCHDECGHDHGEGSIWRDMKVFGHYAYTVTEASGGIQIIDLKLIDSGTVAVIDTGGQIGPATSHNVTVNAESGFLYLTGSSAHNGGLIAYDLSDPTDPRFAGAWSVRYLHDALVVSYSHGAYAGREIAYGFGEGDGVYVIDVTDKQNMVTLATQAYPNVTYAHFGALSQDRHYLFVNDELDERNHPSVSTSTTYVLDVLDPAQPKYVTSFTNGSPAVDHNLMIQGDFLFEVNYRSGLRVYDVQDVHQVQEVAYYDTYPANDNAHFNGAWGVDVSLPSGVVIVSDIEGGLYVLDASSATTTQAVQVIDNADPGFAVSGDWTGPFVGQGFLNDVHFSRAGTGSDVATWSFTGLTPGQYRVSTTWSAHPNRATNAPFAVLDGTVPQGPAIQVNQELEPSADVIVDGVAFQHLGTFDITGSTLTVQLTDDANQYVIADAVRIERVADESLTLSIAAASLSESGQTTTATLTRSGSTSGPLDVTLTNSDVTEATIPATVRILAGQSSVSFAVSSVDDSILDGTQTVTITASAAGFSNGSDTIQVTDDDAGQTVQVIDNADLGFAVSGDWTGPFVGQGFLDDVHFSRAGTGSDVATWSFTGLTPGQYRVSTTWSAHPNRATNAPFVVLDGAVQQGPAVQVNQELEPSADVTVDGVAFQHLGIFDITGSTLTVQLTDDANQYVIADAVRIERVGDLDSPLGNNPNPVTFQVNYNDAPGEGFFDPVLGTARRNAFEFALDIWSSQIASAYPGQTITIAATMDPLGGSPNSAVLGQAGSVLIHSNFGGDSLSNTWYGSALANHLAGRDLSTSSDEMVAQFNSDLDNATVLGTTDWYYGVDAKPGADIDFTTVVLHEIGHGLNFFDVINSNGSWFASSQPGIYDRFLINGANGGTSLANMTNAQRLAAITSNNLFWSGSNGTDGNGGSRPKLYAPSTLDPGSSVAHLDEGVHRNELMSPFYSGPDHEPSLIELGMMADMGWDIPTVNATS